jgi:hypothetical protein
MKRTAVVLNWIMLALIALMSLVYFFLGLSLREFAKSLFAAILLFPAPIMNLFVLKSLWPTGAGGDANQRLQATRETRAPEA